MAYTDYLVEIFKFIGVPALISIGVTAYAKSNYDKKLEKVKLRNAKKLSDFQSEINTLKSKENFKFTKLHEKRLEVLQKTFQHLNENLSLLSQYISPVKFTPDGEDFDEREQKLSQQYRDAHNIFLNYFNYNVIYFDEEIENLLRSFFNESGEIFNLYDKKIIMKSMGEKLDRKEMLESAFAYKKIPEIIYPLKKEIEIKFRKLLGE
jgi:hypothetical protein